MRSIHQFGLIQSKLLEIFERSGLISVIQHANPHRKFSSTRIESKLTDCANDLKVVKITESNKSFKEFF